jgi:hypothetical protein
MHYISLKHLNWCSKTLILKELLYKSFSTTKLKTNQCRRCNQSFWLENKKWIIFLMPLENYMILWKCFWWDRYLNTFLYVYKVNVMIKQVYVIKIVSEPLFSLNYKKMTGQRFVGCFQHQLNGFRNHNINWVIHFPNNQHMILLFYLLFLINYNEGCLLFRFDCIFDQLCWLIRVIQLLRRTSLHKFI